MQIEQGSDPKSELDILSNILSNSYKSSTIEVGVLKHYQQRLGKRMASMGGGKSGENSVLEITGRRYFKWE